MIIIRKVKEEFGFLSNMSPHPVVHQGKEWRTTEALFQSLRFDDLEIIEAIRAERSPMGAKMKAKAHKEQMTLPNLGEQDLNNMRMCLRLKVQQHPKILKDLLDTGDEIIVEDCTKRQHGTGLFWGAAISDTGELTGENWLGKLWMELRREHILS